MCKKKVPCVIHLQQQNTRVFLFYFIFYFYEYKTQDKLRKIGNINQKMDFAYPWEVTT